MSLFNSLRKPSQESRKVDATLTSIQHVESLTPQGDVQSGVELTFNVEGHEMGVIFAIGQRNLTRKIERFFNTEMKFGKERFQQPDWATYDGSTDLVKSESGLTIPELVVSSLTYDAKYGVDLDPSQMLVHHLFRNNNTGESLWATEYSAFIYVDANGRELAPGFGSRNQELVEQSGGNRQAMSGLRRSLIANRAKK